MGALHVPTTTSAGSRAAKGEASRRRILDAAAACFCEVGFQRTRFEDVARSAAVSRALIYSYFGSKENLLVEVRDRALLEWRVAVIPDIERAVSASAKLAAMLRQTLLYARSHPLLQAILADDARVVVPGAETKAGPGLEAWRRRLVRILRQGVASGELREDLDVARTADVLRAMQLGLIDRMHRRPDPIDVGDEVHVEAAVEMVLHGLVGKSEASDSP
ncbi:MAG: TetR/AcrR family transcriptional regulator [Candidatus Binatia bacterium]